MEESREVYETATNQLGSFLELVSNKLTMNRSGPEVPGVTGVTSVTERQDRRMSSDDTRTMSSTGPRSTSSVRGRSQSENNRRKSIAHALASQRVSRYLTEDPSLSPSTSCASSSLSESDRRTSDKMKHDRKSDIISDNRDTTDDGDYNNISILSSCTCVDDNVDTNKKNSKTRNTLKRITSFMRKDKCKNLNLVETGPGSMKYSR